MLQGLTTSTDRIWDLVRTLPKNFRVLVPSAIFQLNHVKVIILEEKTFPCCLITSSSSDTNSQVLGSSFHLKRFQNLGIAEKGEGGSDPCQDFFGGFDTVHRVLPRVIT